jgi:CO/xanthine dehydrogenase Mo-binding subunit
MPNRLDGADHRAFPGRTAAAKIAGTYRFLTDTDVPGSLWAAVVRSPHPHARVIRIDRGKTLASPGVAALFTAADVPGTPYNPATLPAHVVASAPADKRLLTESPRHVGDGVALVVADTRLNAWNAARRATVDWEILPPVLSAARALCEGKVLTRVSSGPEQVTAALSAAYLLVDQELILSKAQHICLESHACAAIPGPGDQMTLLTNAQCPAEIRRLVAEILDLAPDSLRVIKYDEGGGFGEKQELYEEALITYAARELRRPVRLALTRAEAFGATRVRHGGTLRLRAGFTADGRVTATDLEAVLDAGAYASHSPYVLSCLAGHLPVVYPRALHRFRGCAVRTHTVPSGAYRGYGVAQAATIGEQVMDEAAQRLGLSPVTLRLRNLDGPVGDRLARCLGELAWPGNALGQPEDRAQSQLCHGVGLAVAVKSSVTEPESDRSRAWLRVARDMSVVLGTGTCDSGTGSSAALAQIVAEELGMPTPAAVEVIAGDTARAPADVGSAAQRSVFVGGGVARRAAALVAQQLRTVAARTTGREVTTIELRWPRLIDADKGTTLCSVADLLAGIPGHHITAEAELVPPGTGTSVCVIWVAITVDRVTGVVRVDDVRAVVDCGRVVNPPGARGQIAGGVSQGIGLALTDRFGDTTPSILSHGALRSTDLPAIHTVFCGDSPEAESCGIGELAIVAAPGAVANAVANAIDGRCAAMPMRPEVVVAALEDRC